MRLEVQLKNQDLPDSIMEKVSSMNKLSLELLAILRKEEVTNVNIKFNNRLEKILEKIQPRKFSKKQRDSLFNLNMYLKQFNFANEYSALNNNPFKERKIILLQEIYSDKGNNRTLIDYNTNIDDKVMTLLKSKFSDSHNIDYNTNESGFLIVYDSAGYANNRQQIKLQFIVRKIFDDLNYKNLIATEVNTAFKDYFIPPDEIYPKMIILCGKTISNTLLFQKIRIFDPFAKVAFLTVDDLAKQPDEIFDNVIKTLGDDYSYEYNVYSTSRDEKEQISANEQKTYRDRISKLSRNFSVTGFIQLAYELEERNKKCDVHIQREQLVNILSNTKYPKERLFEIFLKN